MSTGPLAAHSGFISIEPFGPDAYLAMCEPEEVAGLSASICELLPEVRAHGGEGAVLVQFSQGADREAILSGLRSLEPAHQETTPQAVVLPVTYDGPDLESVAKATGLSVAEVISRHSAGVYRSMFCGFVPGFSYLSGLDPALHLPRMSTPRTRVPAGSVAIAAHYCAVYPSASPGGWHLIGSCAEQLFDAADDVPVRLPPGTLVRFEPTT